MNDAISKAPKALGGRQGIRNKTAAGPNYCAPTVLANAAREMQLSCEETFGPAVPVFDFSSEAKDEYRHNKYLCRGYLG